VNNCRLGNLFFTWPFLNVLSCVTLLDHDLWGKCRLNCFRSLHLVRVVNQCPCCSSPDHQCFNCANYSVFSPCEWTSLDSKFKLVVTGTATSFGMNTLLQSTRVSSNVSRTCSHNHHQRLFWYLHTTLLWVTHITLPWNPIPPTNACKRKEWPTMFWGSGKGRNPRWTDNTVIRHRNMESPDELQALLPHPNQ
jgi:hypothetical protein